jgi:endonuclease/exonuclease/phosphatase family metal-dependent hydrolase
MRNLVLLAFVFCSNISFAQSQKFTLATYNSLRYSPTNIDDRHPALRNVINELKPDILCVQELSGLASAQMYMDSVLNLDSTTYSMANFVDGNRLDIALYYKTNLFSFLSATNYPTLLRDIFHYQLIPNQASDTLHIFGVHLKASAGSSDKVRRKDEVDVLRQVTDQFAAGKSFLVCGDFNIYSANEPAYIRLLENTPNNNGHFIDPLSLSGTWNNANYAPHHTQSPRTTSFNGGAAGGMDDRFDMILMSEAMNDSNRLHYIPGSLLPFGNDGLRYNQAINGLPTNTAVGQLIADALHEASDHLPVLAEFEYFISGVSLPEMKDHNIAIANTAKGLTVLNPENRNIKIEVYLLDGRKVSTIFSSQTTHLEVAKNQMHFVSILDLSTGSHIGKLSFIKTN